MIRILLVDDHPAIRAGLRALLRGEPGLVPVAAAGSAGDALVAFRRDRPQVVVLDVHMPGGSGLLAARRLKAEPNPPRIVLFSAFADDELLVPARIAGVDAMLGKETGGEALFDTIRQVHAHGRVLPRPAGAVVEAGLARLDPEDQSLAAMLLADLSEAEVAELSGIAPAELAHRVERVLGRLQG